MEEPVNVIDIKKALRNSNSRFLKSLPDFAIKLIEKLIHQDELNTVLYLNRDKSGVPFINKVLNDWNITVEAQGEENIPSSGRFIIVSNHPLGGIDGMALCSIIYRYFPQVISPSNEMLNQIPNLKPLILGINVFGKNSRETIERINKLFESDDQIIIFPSGEVSRRKNKMICDPLWQKSFITKAIQFKRDIIPVHISGRNSDLFYNIANIRKLLGIKMYLETALLPREMMKQKNSTVILTIGKVITFQTFTNKMTHREWAQNVKDLVYKLSRDKS
jgi:1-acyl-sn-glycerol-3-phosphate acyltransferase